MRKLSYLLCIMVLFSLVSCGNKEEKKETETKTETAQTEGAKKYKVGITQIVSHPALDQSREGFKDALKEAGLDVEYDQTVAKTNGGNTRSRAGKVFDVDADGVWVDFR